MVYSCRMLLHKGRGIMLFMFSITTSFVLSSGDQYFGKFFFIWYKLFPNFYIAYFLFVVFYQKPLSKLPNKCCIGFFLYIRNWKSRFSCKKKKSKTTLLVPFYMYSIPIPGWTCIIRKWHHYIWYTCTSWFTYIDKKDSFLMG